MDIAYDLTVELKGDCGYSSSVNPLIFHSVSQLKDRMSVDFNSDDYRVSSLGITFNDHTRVCYYYPSRVDVYMIDGDVSVRLLKTYMEFHDLIHTLEEYANYDY